MLTIKAMTGGETYARNYLSQRLSNNDYYSESQKITGMWMGHGAELLGMRGEVDIEGFDRLREGYHPETGEFLRQRESTNRYGVVERDGQLNVEKTGTARNMYDFTFSAPKDVSIQALFDKRLVDAHHRSVDYTVKQMETFAGVRVRKNHADYERQTGNMVIARYHHDTSRELDPQLHSHVVGLNMSFDGVEKIWKALSPQTIYALRGYLTEVYRNELARECMGCGYEIEDHQRNGQDNGFGLKGFSEETREKFSRRSLQREDAIADFIEQNGRRPSQREIAVLVRETRATKMVNTSPEAVFDSQMGRFSRTEKEFHQAEAAKAHERGSLVETVRAADSIDYAVEHLFERVSVAKHKEIEMEALVHGRGKLASDEVDGEVLARIARGEMLTARNQIATQETLDRELAMVSAINAGANTFGPLNRGLQIVVSDTLRPEQREAVTRALSNRDLAFNISGAAGVGKTYALKDFRRCLQEARVNLSTVAPTARAVEVLHTDGIPEAMTIARLLADPKEQAALNGGVLLVDEAGMVSSKNMLELIQIAQQQHARIVFSGDTAQIKSVEAGDALRVLEERSSMQTVSMREVVRQKNAEYKAAMEKFRIKPVEGLAMLDKMGAVREVDWRLTGRETARAYREHSAIANREGKQRSVIVVAFTHDQISSITHGIRADRKAAGEIQHGKEFTKLNSLDWTEAQKRLWRRYEPGQVLVFHKATKGIAKNEGLEVVSRHRDGLTARRADASVIAITRKQTGAFAVFEKEQMEISAGDRLLLQANWKEKGRLGFKAQNGELVTVASIEGGVIKLQDGRQLPANYRQLTSGYAITADSAQAVSVDVAINLADGMARDRAYVGLTRGKEDVVLLTSDKEALKESLAASADRQSASELAERAEWAKQRIRWDDYQMYSQFQKNRMTVAPAQVQRQEIRHSVAIS